MCMYTHTHTHIHIHKRTSTFRRLDEEEERVCEQRRFAQLSEKARAEEARLEAKEQQQRKRGLDLTDTEADSDSHLSPAASRASNSAPTSPVKCKLGKACKNPKCRLTHPDGRSVCVCILLLFFG